MTLAADPADPAAVLPAGLLERLEQRYARPPRHHHTLRHAEDVARHAAELGGDRPCVLAAWFHDAVYDAAREDNEVASAALLRSWLPADPDTAEAARLVALTAGHTAAPDDRRGAILCDADLAVLGAEAAGYTAYRRAVRREFAHVPEERWRTGRAAVLEDFLSRPRIFRTRAGHDRWEDRARRNLRAELETLQGEVSEGPQP